MSRLLDHGNKQLSPAHISFRHTTPTLSHVRMYLFILCLNFVTNHLVKGDITQDDVGYLNELPLDKLLRLKNSLQVLVKTNYDNLTSTTAAPPSLDMRVDHFGAQALGLKSPLDRGDLKLKPPIKRGDDWEGLTKKGDHGKMSNIFSMAVTVLAFLAFGGYLLCLIVQAIRSKQSNQMMLTTVAPTTVFLNSGIKKRPQTHFTSSSYGRRRRDVGMYYSADMDLEPEQLFTALLGLCEGYAKWNMHYSD